MADAEVHLKLVKAHLAALVAAESLEVELHEVENLPPTELADGEAGTARRIAAPGKDRSPTPRPGAGRGSGSSNGRPRPETGEHLACPMRECQGSATHPLDECERFRSLPVAQRERMVRNWSCCECCLTDCRDRRTGLEQGAAIRGKRLGGLRADTSGSSCTRHEVASEDEPEGRPPDVSQRGIGSGEAALEHHPRSSSKDGEAARGILHDFRVGRGRRG